MSDLRKEIESAINRCSAENRSNTPDFVLAEFLLGCLAAFDKATQQRETWYGRDARPSLSAEPTLSERMANIAAAAPSPAEPEPSAQEAVALRCRIERALGEGGTGDEFADLVRAALPYVERAAKGKG